MSVDNILSDNQEVVPLTTDLEGLNEVYRDIADEIGLENTLIIFKLFHGTQISFPNRLFSKEYTHQAILNEYNGKNVSQLAQKYNYSERSIWRIIKNKSIRRTDK
ncbi:MAG: Mor transcription activator family protein [Clostridia bacterium]|nr:Mor transcription activator family protein [Clostridia bacterium]